MNALILNAQPDTAADTTDLYADEYHTDAGRLWVAAQDCAPWCRQQENFSLSVSRERARQCSQHIQRMLGYSIYTPFIGFVDGLHPNRLLEP